jgi:hypothetical protein
MSTDWSKQRITKRNLAKFMREVANLIEKRGLHKGNYTNGRGKYCLLGAMNKVETGHPYVGGEFCDRFADTAERVLQHQLLSRWISEFSDAQDGNAAPVLGLLRNTAAKLERGLSIPKTNFIGVAFK